MALQPNIILAGAQPDILGAMSRGNELAAQTNTLRDQNALRQVYQTQGADLLAGKPQAINALAMIDPMTAANIRNTNLEGTYTAERTRILGAEEQRKIAEAARTMDEQQKAAALEATKREVFRFLAAPDAATFDQMVTQAGKPELVGQFERRQILAADYVSSVEEAMKLGAGPAPVDPIKGAPTGYKWTDPANPAAGVELLPGYERKPMVEVTNTLPGQDKLDDEFAKLDAQDLKTIDTTGRAAIRNIGRIERLAQLLESGGSGAGAALQRLAGEFGLQLGENTSDIQAAQAIINSLVPEQRQPGSGPMSDADLALFKQSLPRIINQPGGNAIILQTMRGIAEYDAEGARIVQQYRSGQIDRATAFDMLQNRKNPLEGFAPPAGNQTPSPAAQPEAAAPAGDIPATFLANPAAKAAADRAGVTVEELWQYVSPQVREMMPQ